MVGAVEIVHLDFIDHALLQGAQGGGRTAAYHKCSPFEVAGSNQRPFCQAVIFLRDEVDAAVKKMVAGHIRYPLHGVFHGKGHILLPLQEGFLSMLPVKARDYVDGGKAAAELGYDLGQEIDGGTDGQGKADAFGVFGAEILTLLNGGFQLSVKRAQPCPRIGRLQG